MAGVGQNRVGTGGLLSVAVAAGSSGVALGAAVAAGGSGVALESGAKEATG